MIPPDKPRKQVASTEDIRADAWERFERAVDAAAHTKARNNRTPKSEGKFGGWKNRSMPNSP